MKQLQASIRILVILLIIRGQCNPSSPSNSYTNPNPSEPLVILSVVFSSDVIISPYPLKMSPQNSASYFTLPRMQACFPRPIVLFCLGDGISLTASAYRGMQSNANSADRNVTYNLVVVFSSVKLKSYSFFS